MECVTEIEQKKKNEEMLRLIKWVSKNWYEWKMLCNPAITDTEIRTKRRKWVEALKGFANFAPINAGRIWSARVFFYTYYKTVIKSILTLFTGRCILTV